MLISISSSNLKIAVLIKSVYSVSHSFFSLIPSVDLSGSDCDALDGYYIGDRDMNQVYHRPNFNTRSTRDRCEVTLRTDPKRRLEYSIDVLKFYECGVDIYIYDDPRGNFNPKVIFMYLFTTIYT